MTSPEPSPAERALLDVYQAAEQHLLRAATMQYRSVVRGPDETEAARRRAGAATVAAVTEQVVGFLDEAIPGLLGEILVAAAQRGEAEAVRQLQAARGGDDGYTARGTNLGALDRLAVGLLARAAEAHNAILRVAPDVFRQALAQVLPAALVGVDRRLDASQRAWWDLTQRGITRFQDQAGRNWRLSSYVEMAARTGVARAQLDAQHDRLASLGHDLVVVNGSGDRCEKCRPWHGKVLTTSGSGRRTLQLEHATRDGETITVQVAGSVDDARRDGWGHPQCRCSTSVYLPGVTTVPPLARDNGQYEARQRQRAIERQIRAAKEREQAALDSAAQRQARAQVRAGQARMRDHLAGNPDLLRRAYREQPGAGNIPRRPPSSPHGPRPTNGPTPGPGPVDQAGRERQAADQWEAQKRRVADQERVERERLEQQRRAQREQEAQERELRQRQEREGAERAAREKAEREQRERTEREAAEQARRDAEERAARQLAERQRREAEQTAARERADREKTERKAKADQPAKPRKTKAPAEPWVRQPMPSRAEIRRDYERFGTPETEGGMADVYIGHNPKTGRKLVFKESKTPQEASREVAAAEVAAIIGARVPGVVRMSRTQTVHEFVPGRTIWAAKRNKQKREEALASPDNDDLALLDELTDNWDRNLGNVMVTPDGTMWGIDHGNAFGNGAQSFNGSLFLRGAAFHGAERPGITLERVEKLGPQLEAMRPRFTEIFGDELDVRGQPLGATSHAKMMSRYGELLDRLRRGKAAPMGSPS